MEIGIKVIAENIRTQDFRQVDICFPTMITVDDERKSVRQAAAELRRQIRRELKQRLSAL